MFIKQSILVLINTFDSYDLYSLLKFLINGFIGILGIGCLIKYIEFNRLRVIQGRINIANAMLANLETLCDLSKDNIILAGHKEFVYLYIYERRRSLIQFVTPNQRHTWLDKDILAKRSNLYQKKRKDHPERWSTKVRDWQPIGDVELNPEQHKDAA
ncbi:hypothetical protein MSP8887_00560 [Marinomonas spartinae]|nr:hypothetical protein MSP8887_00560 [Marinomonas spartinae]